MFLQYDQLLNPFPGFTLVWNKSNNTYDLLIENVTESDLGLYYCGTVALKVVETPPDKIKEEKLYLYGDITISLSFGKNVSVNLFQNVKRQISLIEIPQNNLK